MSKLMEILSKIPAKFDEPLNVPMVIPVRIYSIEKTRDGLVMVQLNDGHFHQLEEKDRNYDAVADAILNRLNNIR